VNVWFDAACISYEERQGKQSKSALMDGIYKQASHVLAWLGEETEHDKVAFSFAESFSSRRSGARRIHPV
jgi:hypothetical protein